MLANLIINFAHFFTFKIQVDDYKYNEYVKYHFMTTQVIYILTFVISLHMFRLLYGKLFSLPIFHAATTAPERFYKPLLLYSLI
jgi:hypothetical protein